MKSAADHKERSVIKYRSLFVLQAHEEKIMLNQFSRTELLLGKEAMEILEHSRVAVFGIGGVGGYVVEALARSGVGALTTIRCA